MAKEVTRFRNCFEQCKSSYPRRSGINYFYFFSGRSGSSGSGDLAKVSCDPGGYPPGTEEAFAVPGGYPPGTEEAFAAKSSSAPGSDSGG